MRIIFIAILMLSLETAAAAGPCSFLRKLFAVEMGETAFLQRDLIGQGILVKPSQWGSAKNQSLQVEVSGESELNSFARYVDWSYNGLEIHLDAGLSGAGAYNFLEHKIILGKGFLTQLMEQLPLGDISTTLRHELVHARLTRRNYRGERTIFDGELRVTEGTFADGQPIYRERFSFQEFAATGWQFFFHVRQAKRLAAEGRDYSEEMLKAKKRLLRWHIFYNRYATHMPQVAREVMANRFRTGVGNLNDDGQKVMISLINKPFAFGYLRPNSNSKQSAADLRREATTTFLALYKNRSELAQLNQSLRKLEQDIDAGRHPQDVEISSVRKQFMSLVDR